MKKRIICIFVTLLGLMAIPLSGCNILDKYADPWDLKKEDQGYYYYVVGDNGYPEAKNNEGKGAVILGLVDEEAEIDEIAEIDELVIPETLGGYPVVQIGKTYQMIGATRYYGINASKFKRIIINHECTIDWEHSFCEFEGELIINADVMLNSWGEIAKTIIFNVDFSSLTDYKQWDLVSEANTTMFKVLFNSIEGEQKTQVIIIKENKLLPVPEAPTKIGYTFVGWYTDENYEKEWDFETDTVTENMTLYAKWIEN